MCRLAVLETACPQAFRAIRRSLCTRSAELLAAVLQMRGRATVLGETSCGCMNPSLGWFALPGGAQLLISEARLPLVDGTRIEGRGVVPDAEAAPGDGDAVLTAALRRLQDQARR